MSVTKGRMLFRSVVFIIAITAAVFTLDIHRASAVTGEEQYPGLLHSMCVNACEWAGDACEDFLEEWDLDWLCGLGEVACKDWCDENLDGGVD